MRASEGRPEPPSQAISGVRAGGKGAAGAVTKNRRMPPDAGKNFDPISQFTELASFWTGLGNPYRSLLTGLTHYEGLDPAVQEIAILAAMHNMASMLKNSEKVKAAVSAEISERALKLAQQK
jgi:hypothetical protein